MIALRPLRPHQERAFDSLRASLASGHRHPMLQAPTGFGKTLTAAHIIQCALDKGKRVAFTVPALSLIDQTVAAFEAEGIHCIGVMQGIHGAPPIAISRSKCAPVQTVARRKRPDVDLVIVDEAHQLHREIFRWMKDFPQHSLHRLIGDALGARSRQILRRSDHSRDHRGFDPRWVSVAVRRLCSERT